MTKKAQTDAIKSTPIFQSLNERLGARLDLYFWICFGLLFLMALLFFDPKVSIGGDDSEYLNRAYQFIHNGKFPTFQGPLYPIVMGLTISVTGLNLVLIKFTSIIFMLVHFWLFFQTFRKHLTPVLMVGILFILSINASMLYFASSTFTESFFLMIQSLFLFSFEKCFISGWKEKYTLKEDYKRFLLLGFTLFLMAITKNIGLTAIIGTSLFFVVRLKWMALIYTIIVFILCQVLFIGIKTYVFEVKDRQVSSQGNTLMMKHPYDESIGKEDFGGYVDRVVINSKEYLSRHFTLIYGLNSEIKPGVSGFITLFIYVILFTGFILLFRQSEFWTFNGIYLIASCGITFIVLQTYWSQERLILVYTPLILVYLLYSIYYIIDNHSPKLKWLFTGIFILFIAANLIRTAKKLPQTIDSLGHYLKGETTYGFTPDWINYFGMSKWITSNLPEGTLVGCRKPGMAFLYSGGKEFYGIWRVPSDNPEELYNQLKDAGVTHVMMASLRLDPNRNTGRTINTVRRFLSIIHEAYPDKIEFVHKIGEQEPVFLYKLN